MHIESGGEHGATRWVPRLLAPAAPEVNDLAALIRESGDDLAELEISGEEGDDMDSARALRTASSKSDSKDTKFKEQMLKARGSRARNANREMILLISRAVERRSSKRKMILLSPWAARCSLFPLEARCSLFPLRSAHTWYTGVSGDRQNRWGLTRCLCLARIRWRWRRRASASGAPRLLVIYGRKSPSRLRSQSLEHLQLFQRK